MTEFVNNAKRDHPNVSDPSASHATSAGLALQVPNQPIDYTFDQHIINQQFKEQGIELGLGSKVFSRASLFDNSSATPTPSPTTVIRNPTFEVGKLGLDDSFTRVIDGSDEREDRIGAFLDMQKNVHVIRLVHPDIDRTKYYVVGLPEAINARVVDRTLNHSDKVAQRTIADQIGIFSQPEWRDERALNIGSEYLIFRDIPYTQFPVDQILSQPGHYLFEDSVHGFLISSDKNGRINIESQSRTFNTALLLANSASNTVGSPEDMLNCFLSALEKIHCPLALERSKSQFQRRKALLPIAERILSEERSVYVKSARTSGGDMIIKVNKNVHGEPCISTNSPDAIEYIDLFFNRYVKNFGRANAVSVMIQAKHAAMEDMTLETYANYFTPTVPNVLTALLLEMEHPIVEREIPRIKVNGELVEFRLIFQRNVETGQLELTADYAKVSPLGVAANVKISGRGERSSEMMLGVVNEAFPSSEHGANRHIAEMSLGRLREQGLIFARTWSARMAEVGFLDHGGPVGDFAIDLIPYLNQESGQVEFSFLEVQTPYAFEGLVSCEPELAQEVALRKQALKESRDHK